jgi:hypothetical protein
LKGFVAVGLFREKKQTLLQKIQDYTNRYVDPCEDKKPSHPVS